MAWLLYQIGSVGHRSPLITRLWFVAEYTDWKIIAILSTYKTIYDRLWLEIPSTELHQI